MSSFPKGHCRTQRPWFGTHARICFADTQSINGPILSMIIFANDKIDPSVRLPCFGPVRRFIYPRLGHRNKQK